MKEFVGVIRSKLREYHFQSRIQATIERWKQRVARRGGKLPMKDYDLEKDDQAHTALCKSSLVNLKESEAR